MLLVSDEDVIEFLKQSQCLKESEESEWSCPICQSLVYDPMVCQNCEPLYCRSCLQKYKNKKCPTCNLVTNFNNAPLKLKNILMQLKLKGCPANKCNLVNTPMTYEEVIKHLTHQCNQIIGKCDQKCGKKLLRNEIDNHMAECSMNADLDA